jgi:hypothetical protein
MIMTKDINLFDLGCLVQVSIGMWSARKMLTKEDLRRVGVAPEGVPDDICNLSRKLLVGQVRRAGPFILSLLLAWPPGRPAEPPPSANPCERTGVGAASRTARSEH